MKVKILALALVFNLVFLILPPAHGQTPLITNIPPPGPLSDLEHSVRRLGEGEDLPAKLCALIWPKPGVAPKKIAVKRLAVPGKHDGEGRLVCLRPDNHDLVLMSYSEDKLGGDSKVRQEYYFRTTAQGDLTQALTATFQFTIDDVDNELLKKVTWQTYGAISGDGTKPLAFTPEILKRFEAEKKFWLKQEKTFKKQERGPKE